ncbi:unnamed protein product [Closterium sp. Naga37s-1]|nr:unnamed protein product [Closterium sp. Naga37s-1]
MALPRRRCLPPSMWKGQRRREDLAVHDSHVSSSVCTARAPRLATWTSRVHRPSNLFTAFHAVSLFAPPTLAAGGDVGGSVAIGEGSGGAAAAGVVRVALAAGRGQWGGARSGRFPPAAIAQDRPQQPTPQGQSMWHILEQAQGVVREADGSCTGSAGEIAFAELMRMAQEERGAVMRAGVCGGDAWAEVVEVDSQLTARSRPFPRARLTPSAQPTNDYTSLPWSPLPHSVHICPPPSAAYVSFLPCFSVPLPPLVVVLPYTYSMSHQLLHCSPPALLLLRYPFNFHISPSSRHGSRITRVGTDSVLVATWHHLPETPRQEEQLRRGKEVEEASGDARSILAKMSHEIRPDGVAEAGGAAKVRQGGSRGGKRGQEDRAKRGHGFRISLKCVLAVRSNLLPSLPRKPFPLLHRQHLASAARVVRSQRMSMTHRSQGLLQQPLLAIHSFDDPSVPPHLISSSAYLHLPISSPIIPTKQRITAIAPSDNPLPPSHIGYTRTTCSPSSSLSMPHSPSSITLDPSEPSTPAAATAATTAATTAEPSTPAVVAAAAAAVTRKA